MRRSLLALLVVLVPILLFVNVYYAFRHGQLVREIELLETEQRELIEANKRAILAISVLSSPDRIGEIARDDLGLQRITPEQVDHIQIGGAE